MLVKLVVVTLCVIWVAGELQCSGPGRFSTTPGMCTSEYYTCNRDNNKEYIAYVLSCPGNTLFNERTRKCSGAKAVNCIYPSNTTPSGQIKVTTLRRQKLTSQHTSPRISRPTNLYKLTTKKPVVEYRKPGRLPWVTPRPHFTTVTPQIISDKPQKSQWRIRQSTSKRSTSSKSHVSPSTFITHRRTYIPNQKKNVMRHSLYREKVNHLSSNSVKIKWNGTPMPQAMAGYLNLNGTTNAVLNANRTNFPTSPLIPLSATKSYPDFSQITKIMPNSSLATDTIEITTKSSLYMGFKTQIPPNVVIHSMVTTAPPITSRIEYNLETTPEVILINQSNSHIPFIDSLEPGVQNVGVEIVDVVFNSTSNLTKKMATDPDWHHNTPIKYIQYFSDPDAKTLIGKDTNTFNMSRKKHKQKTEEGKNRQPKIDRIRHET